MRSLEIGEERGGEFWRGGRRRYFFPHTIVRLPKCGPDAYKLGLRLFGEDRLDRHWEIVIHAAPSLVEELPGELFFDRDLIWHEQHFGLPGQVATANVVLDGERMWAWGMQSDLVQRIKLRPEYKARVNTLFRSWPRMIMNAILDFARERGVSELRTARSEIEIEVSSHTRPVGPELFERIYDRSLKHLDGVRPENGWWLIDVDRNRERIVLPEPRRAPLPVPERVVCVCHDLERGLGHVQTDSALAREADRLAEANLERTLALERKAGVRATYNVVGQILPDVRERVEADGHAIAFHSYDHALEPSPEDDEHDQLRRCRTVDYRAKGYRPVQSSIGPDLRDERLAFHNFEWLASSAYSLGTRKPELRNRLVRVPIHLDDFGLYRRGRPYRDWEQEAIELVEREPFTALCLHDCYAPLWLNGYSALLERLQERAELRTVDELSATVLLASAE